MVGQDFDETYVVSKNWGKEEWMSWECFAGSYNGPCLIWDKD